MSSLSNTNLHFVKCGIGEPLVIVPATVSLIRQWVPLVQFMGQRFTAYFFELPGHGESSPYPVKFESRLVPDTVAAFMDSMGHERFNLMGFSFGGLLALRTLEVLQARIDKVVLLSPCVTNRALKYSPLRKWGFRRASSVLKRQAIQHGLTRLMHSGRIDRPLIYALSKASNIEKSILKSKDALKIPSSTLDVLAHTVDELFQVEFRSPHRPFSHPCFFGMSIYDDLLDYDLTYEIVREHFRDLTVRTFTLPYHQPPDPPTFDWLQSEFGHFLSLLP